jgi:hypothetical protein
MATMILQHDLISLRYLPFDGGNPAAWGNDAAILHQHRGSGQGAYLLLRRNFQATITDCGKAIVTAWKYRFNDAKGDTRRHWILHEN